MIRRRNAIIDNYVIHLPRAPLDAPEEPGRFYHICILHDFWCARFDGGPCNCSPIITRHVEPLRT
jgi:hypothetical protein